MENSSPDPKPSRFVGSYFTPEALGVEFECDAKYAQAVYAEVYDALIEAARDQFAEDGGKWEDGWPNLSQREFLGRLWNRGFKVVPRNGTFFDGVDGPE